MDIGAVFPQTEIGRDVGAVRSYAVAVEELGYRHLLTYDHVLGADRAVHTDWKGFYDLDDSFHEPFVLYGFLAGATRLALATAIVVLPQRQTALVAKQAAEVDLLTEGRFRLGVGLGWNEVEYRALGKPFADRSQRIEEQVALLRALWSNRSVTFDGEFEAVAGAGLSPLPCQQPIPIWFGADSEPAFARVGRLADGWFPEMLPGQELSRALEHIAAGARSVGRDPFAIEMEGRVRWNAEDPATFVRQVEDWRAVGASRVAINTMAAGLENVDDHIDALARAAELLGGLQPKSVEDLVLR